MLAAGASAVGAGLGKVAGWLAWRPGEAECAGCTQRAAELEATREELRQARQAESGARGEANYRQALWLQARERAQEAQAELERVRGEAGPARVAELERELARKERTIERQAQQLAAKQQESERLRAYNRKLKKMQFGRKSERKRGRKQASERGAGGKKERKQRGRQPGTPSHGRTKREGLEVREEVLEPAAEQCRCPRCGRGYTRHATAISELHEIKVKAHTRRIKRPRWRPVCQCPEAREAVAAPPPRLFPGTPYGITVWAWFLVHVYAHYRPQRAAARELGTFGLPVAAGTLTGHQEDFLRLLQPLEQEIARQQQAAPLAHGDETRWTIHVLGEQGASPRCWLWVCRTADAVRLRVDVSRSALAAAKLFGQLGRQRRIVLVCDRYVVYLTLARTHAGQFVLAYCWAHQRRDFLDLATKRPGLAGWADSWVQRIAELYRLNRQRLEHWDAERSLEEQDAAFQQVQQQLTAALTGLFTQAGEELKALPAPKGKGPGRKPSADLQRAPLQSLLNHREGLETFLTKPFCPLDNNPAERALRGAAIGRKLSFGSFSERGAELAGCLYSVYATLRLAGINPWRWTQAYLQACAEAGGKPPPDARRWLPWGLPPEQVAAWKSGLSPPAQGPVP